jgi:PEP-CTERM motif
VPDPENGNVRVIVKRRPTRRHRRNRFVRRVLFLSALALLTAVASSLALRYIGPSAFNAFLHHDFNNENSDRASSANLDQIFSQIQPVRPVYPYSVVPGGVEDAKELKRVAEHDPIVAAHYAGFDYDHARIVRLTLARTAFVSYRIGNHIYWMRRRITLHKGETLLTDGRITARGRCGNRVEEKPQQEAAANEPAPEKFDQPGAGTAMQSPAVPFESALTNPGQAGGFDPLGPMNLYSPFGGGSLLALSPPLPLGVCAPVKKGSPAGTGATGGKKKPGPCGTGEGPSPVPEPSTWITLISGFAALGWFGRRKLLHTSASN